VDKFLLDTQIFIWWMEENKRLPFKIKSLIDDPTNQIFISVVIPWEIVIKTKLKKLKAPKNFENYLKNDVFEIMPIQMVHVLAVGELPVYKDHNDPFDRLLIAQAKVEKLTLITSDQKIWKYKISLLKS